MLTTFNYFPPFSNSDVDEFLSHTLKKEKLKRDTAARKDELLNELNSLRNKLPPERIPEDLDDEGMYVTMVTRIMLPSMVTRIRLRFGIPVRPSLNMHFILL